MKRAILSIIVLSLFLSVVSLPLAEADSLVLTESERNFIEEHPVIKLGVDPKFVPFEFIDNDDQYKGITADYLALVSERTGLRFEIVQDLTWPEAYEAALDGKVDALPAVSKTPERSDV